MLSKVQFIFLLVFITTVYTAFSQNNEEIQQSGNYYYAIGEGENFEEADRDALSLLASQISVHVKSNFKSIVEEKNDRVKEYAKSVINTYSNTTLPQTPSKIIEEGAEGVKVMRYVKKENLDKVFESRKKKIIDYLQLALEAEKETRIGDALKYYYWSLVLLRSHPELNEIRFTLPGKNRAQSLLTILPNRINRIFDNLNLSLNNVKDKERSKLYILQIYSQNQAVQNFDYTYYTGRGYSRLNSAKDGMGTVELSNAFAKNTDFIRLKTEYKYKSKSGFDMELRDVMEKTQDYIPYFKRATFRLPVDPLAKKTELEKKDEKKKVADDRKMKKPEGKHKTSATLSNIKALKNTSQIQLIKKSIDSVLQAIEKNNYEQCSNHFTSDGYEIYKKLVEYGNATIIDNNPELKILKINNRYLVRSIPMKFSFGNNVREFVEELTFTFTDSIKIDNLAFSLSNRSVQDIMNKERWPEMNRYHLIEFMENFKTAYALERLNFIKSIFADNALIIIGKVVKEAEKIDGMYQNIKGRNVRFIKKTKQEYISSLKNVFRTNEFVNIQFEDAEVKKRAGDEIYGIQIAQNYFSQNYADKGYLFLMFDLTHVNKPKIYVRSWQPYKNPDGTLVPDSSILGLRNFQF